MAARTSPAYGFTIGGEGYSGGSYTTYSSLAKIYEIIVYNSILSELQRQAVEGYLGRKWGITVTGSTFNASVYAKYPPFTRPFVPTDVTDCQLWLDSGDAATLGLSGSSVTQWLDKSGNGNNATSASGTWSSETSGILNPVFKGPITSSGNNPTVCVYIVANKTGVTGTYDNMLALNNSTITNYYAAGTAFFCYYGGNNPPYYYAYMNGNSYLYFSSPFGSPFIFNVYQIGTTSYIYGNGSGPYTATMPGNSMTYTNYYIGTCTGGPAWQGSIYEILVYNTVPTASQRVQIEGYLARKWGITASLPTGHSFKSIPPSQVPFTPTQISGCQLWFDATDSSTLTTSGTTVTSWKDKSSNASTATASGTAIILSNFSGAGGLAGLYFQGAPSTFLNGGFARPILGYGITVFIISTQNSAAAGYARLFSVGTIYTQDYNNTQSFMIGRQNNGNGIGIYRNGNINTVFVNPDPAVCLSTTYWVNGSTGYTTVYSSGVVGTTYSGTSGGNFSIYNYSIGNNVSTSDANAYWGGLVGEIIVYGQTLSRYQRNQVEAYLARKWGLLPYLPTSHTYYKTPPPLPDVVITDPIIFLNASKYDGGSTWYDQASFGRNATIENGTATKNGTINGVYLNGSTNWTFTLYSFVPSYRWTCVVWCKISSISGYGCVLTQIYSGGDIGLVFGQGVYNQGFTFYRSGTWLTGYNTAITSSTWKCFTGVWDGGNMTMYVNGVGFGANNLGASPTATGNGFRIGRRWDNADYVTGYVGEIRIYDKAFTIDEVSADYYRVAASGIYTN